MRVQTIINYLTDLKQDILGNRENERYLAHKVLVLIDKLERAGKEEKKIKSFFKA